MHETVVELTSSIIYNHVFHSRALPLLARLCTEKFGLHLYVPNLVRPRMPHREEKKFHRAFSLSYFYICSNINNANQINQDQKAQRKCFRYVYAKIQCVPFLIAVYKWIYEKFSSNRPCLQDYVIQSYSYSSAPKIVSPSIIMY